ncbi:Trm112 family protein [bacterium]|nr:Trm112 family protein [bacterium]
MALADILDLLRCPLCGGPLVDRIDKGAVECAACRLRYPIEDSGILNLDPREARSTEAS